LFTSLLSPKFTRIPYTTLFRSDFIHGSSITFLQSGSRPIGTNPIPSDVPLWGPEFKKASIENFTKSLSVFGQGASLPQKQRVIRSEEPRLNSSHVSISYAVFCL